MAVVIVADDFTGANDSIARFAAAGAGCVTLFDPGLQPGRPDYQVVALTVNSRGLPPDEAYQANYKAVQQLRLMPEDILYKKVDSGLRGNLGAELDAVLDGLGRDRTALMAPALPENQRITAGGYQLLQGAPVHETELAADPVTPVRESHLPTLLAATSRRKVGYLPLASVYGGVESATAVLRGLMADGCRIIVADATQPRHLDILAQISVSFAAQLLPCGTAGLAGALARRLFAAKPADRPALEAADNGIVAAVIGSRSRNARLQIRRALEALPWLAESVAERAALTIAAQRPDAIRRVVSEAKAAIASGKRAVVIRFDDAAAVDPASLDATLLASGLGEIARLLTEEIGIKTLYLSGGDIAAGAVKALGGWGLEVESEIEPGVCAGRLRGGRFEGLRVITKAGSFGDSETLAKSLRS